MAQTLPKFCPRCGRPTTVGQTFCANCGLVMAAPADNRGATPEPPTAPLGQPPTQGSYISTGQTQTAWNGEPSFPTAPSSIKKRGSRRGGLVLVLVLVLVLLGA